MSDSLWHDLAPVEWIVTKFMGGLWMNPTVWLVSRRLSDLAGDWDERLSISGDDEGSMSAGLSLRVKKCGLYRKPSVFIESVALEAWTGKWENLPSGWGRFFCRLDSA
jgi:hypothetical protein